MNCSYRSIWNETTGTFVAASENAKGAGKKVSSCSHATGLGARFALKALSVSLLLSFGANLYALPTGGVVAAGSASISSTALTSTITQSSQNAAINWQGFNIASGEAVRFAQPNSNSVMLNRVLGSDPSAIFGSLSANGKVFLVNPNGILFGQGASVNVAGLVASTLNIADSDFMAGNYKFSGSGSGAVVNQGSIQADGGFVALLGASVSNEGVILAKLGTVALAAGNAITLDLAGDGLLNVTVNQGAINALVQNGGLIQADGGQVLLSARSAGNLLQSAVNNTGVIQAQTIENHGGTIRLLGDMQSGTVNLGGTLDVSGPADGQTGGNITATAQHVGLFGAQINASGDAGGGNVLIGGDFQGKNPDVPNATATYMSADSVINADAVTNGNGGNVILWANDSTRAYGSASARGGAQGGDGGLIETSGHWLDVAGINVSARAPYGMNGTWLLDPANIIISGAATSGATLTGSVFAPDAGLSDVVINAGALQATLNGGTDVTITTTNTGLAGAGVGNITVNSALTWGTVPGVTLALNAANDLTVNFAMTASTAGDKMLLSAGHDLNFGAALVASAINTRITLTAGNDILATAPAAAVTATGLGAVIDMSAGHNASVVAVTADGGGAANSVILRANNDVSVNDALSAAGGNVLLRADSDGTGPGLAGGTVKFAGPGAVVASTNTAILFNPNGYPATAAEIAAYGVLVTGALDAKAWVFAKGINKPYDATTTATLLLNGSPAGVTLVPGTANSDTKDVGVAKPITFTGYTTGGPAGYGLWGPYGGVAGSGTTSGDITPVPLNITANGDSKIYNGAAYSGGNGVTYTSFVGGESAADLGGALSYGGSSQGAVNVGAYTITPGGQSSTNYAITYASGALTVNPAALTVTASNASKAYGQTPTLSAFTTAGLLGGDTVGSVTETSPGTVATASVAGSPYVITPSGATGGSFIPGNYTISYVNGALSVTPMALTVTANNASKAYGQTSTLAPTAFTTAGLVNGDTVGSVTETSAGSVATAAVAGSPYAITPSAATGGTFVPANYTIGYVNGVLTVTPVALTVTASNVSKAYGQAVTPSAFTTAGLVNGDTVGSVTETSTGSVATAPVAGSPYAIIPSAATGGTFVPTNYTIGYVNGALTVTPIPLTVTASNIAKSYGQTVTPSAFTTAGLVNGDTVGSVTETSTGSVATAPVAGSPYAIIPSAATGGTFVPTNYTIGYVNGALTVTPIPLTVTASNIAKAYGQTVTPTAFTTAGLVNGDTVASVTETSTGSVATAPVAGSPYVIVPSNAAGGSFVPTNYTIGYVNGVLTVTPALLTVTANNASKAYGQTSTLAPTAFTATGLVNGDSVASVTETSPGTVATAPVAGSPYAITPKDASGNFVPGNYTLAYVNGALTVTPIPLTVTANDVTKNYGETPVLSGFTNSPLVNGETIGSVTETSPGQAANAAPGATYPITPSNASGGTFTPSNYTIGYVNGVLTVIQLPNVIPPGRPFEGPGVPPATVTPTWIPVVMPPATPPQLLTLAPPVVVPPIVALAPVETPVVQPPPVPTVVAAPAPPVFYVAPHRPRKQDRN